MVAHLHEHTDKGQGVGRRLDGVMPAHDDRTALPEGLVRLSDSDIESHARGRTAGRGEIDRPRRKCHAPSRAGRR